ncbi:hypothetical protein FNH09_45670, partial [Streptomyces adustus]|nr:hypothetical protein [Streptomyces adustus]
MVTFAQAQERAEEWVNGDVPAYQHREVRVREFGLGFVVWAEDRVDGPRSDGGAQRLVIARDSGDATLWPGLPVGEVIRRYEEEYGRAEEGEADAAPAPAARVDLNQTSFLLSPPEWLQEAADKLGIPDRRGEGARAASGAAGTGGGAAGAGSLPQTQAGAPGSQAGAPEVPGTGSGAGVSWPVAGGEEGAGASPGAPGGSAGATPWAGTDTNGDFGEDRSVPLPATVFAPPVGDGDDRMQDAKTEMISGGSRLPPTAMTPAFDPSLPPGAPGAPATYGYPQGAGAPAAPAPVPGGTPPPGAVSYGYPQGQPSAPGTPAPGPVPGATPPPVYGYPQTPGAQGAPAVPPPGAPQGVPAPGAPERPLAPNAGDIADAATSKAAPPRRARGSAEPPHPPGVPGAPGVRPGATPPPAPGVPGAPGAGAGAYVPTQLVSALGPDGPQGPGAPQPPGPPAAPNPPGVPNVPGGTPPGGVGGAPHAATMLADPGRPGAPQPPGVPGAPFAPNPPGVPGGPPSAGGPQGAVHHAETVLAAPPV